MKSCLYSFPFSICNHKNIYNTLAMGAKQTKKTVIILDQWKEKSYFNEILEHPDFETRYYQKFSSFLERQNTKNLSDIVIRPKPINIKEEKQAIDFDNPFVEIHPLLVTEAYSMRYEIIQQIRKYSLKINLYLLTEDLTNVQINERDKPYITKICEGCSSVISTIKSNNHKFALNIKLQRLVKDLSRRFTVKIIDPRYHSKEKNKKIFSRQLLEEIQQFEESKLSYEYCGSIEEFEKSLISSTCDYVICFSDDLCRLIDLMKLRGENFSIIWRITDFESEIYEQVQQYKQKCLWAKSSNLQTIINKIKRCTVYTQEKATELSSNTIICGNSCLYELKFQQIQKRLKNSLLGQMGEEKYEHLNLCFLKGYEDYEKMMEILERAPYSYLIVFESGEFLETIKNKLKICQFAHRVQVKAVADQPPGMSKEQEILKFKLDYILENINFKIKFEIGPLNSLHVYRPTLDLLNTISTTLALNIVEIKNIRELKDYLPPRYKRIVDSGHLLTNIRHFQKEIKPLLKQYSHTYFGGIKFIIYDNYDKVRSYIMNEKNYTKEIVFVHYNLDKIIEFVKYGKASVVSIPTYKKKALSGFQTAAKKIQGLKWSSQISITTSVIYNNKILKNLFSNQIKSSIDYSLEFMVFPFSSMNGLIDIDFYKQEYLPKYAELWCIGYDILERNQESVFINFQNLKEQIINSFYRIKNYDLLRLTDSDFINFYINNVKSCQSFIELQMICLYILSLPHGLATVINQLFKRPKKTMMAVKLFRPFILLIFMAMGSFTDNKIEKVEMVSYINDMNSKEKLEKMRENDTIYNSGFGFCCQKHENYEQNNHDIIIFEFENVSFLKKSPIVNNLNIQRFSFYREAAEYVIPPNTPFIVKQKILKKNGKYTIVLKQDQKVGEKSFIEQVLLLNELSCNQIEEVLAIEHQSINNNQVNQQKGSIFQNNQISLFEKEELFHILDNKIKVKQEIKKSLAYNRFFDNIQDGLYESAIDSLKTFIKHEQNLSFTQNNKTIKLLNIEHAYIAYKMSEYKRSIRFLQDVRKSLTEKSFVPESEWIIQKIDTFIVATQQTFRGRKQVIKKAKKMKRWKLKPKITQQGIIFSIKPKKTEWNVDYIKDSEKFSIANKEQPEVKVTVFEPEIQFGSLPNTWSNCDLYKRVEKKQIKKKSYLLKVSEVFEQTKNEMKDQNYKNEASKGSFDKLIGGQIFRSETLIPDERETDRENKYRELIIKKKDINKENIQPKPKLLPLYGKKSSQSKVSFDFTKIGKINEEKEMDIDQISECETPIDIVRVREVNPVFSIQEIDGVQSEQNFSKTVTEGNQEDIYEIEDALGIKNIPNMQWNIFHFENQVKITQKKKHYHKKTGKAKLKPLVW